jgi:hypothetical protein
MILFTLVLVFLLFFLGGTPYGVQDTLHPQLSRVRHDCV